MSQYTFIRMRYTKHMDLYREADQLIEDSQIENVLATFGSVAVEGSYVYRTMVDRDIDYTVTVPKGQDLSFDLRREIACQLIDIPRLRSMEMSDLYHYPAGAKHLIEGIWFGCTILSNQTDQRWNIDIWFVKYDSKLEADDELTYRLKELSDTERVRIVTIKKQLLDAGQKQKGASSVDVYRAVLNEGVTSYEEYCHLRNLKAR